MSAKKLFMYEYTPHKFAPEAQNPRSTTKKLHSGVKNQSLRTEINQGQGLTLTYPKLTHLSQQNKKNILCLINNV